MKSIYQVLFTAVLVMGVFATVLFTSCADKCGGTTCQNGGSCSANVCVCPTGYSGTSCENSWTSPFIGTYKCNQTCTPAASGGTWQSAVTASATNTGYTITIASFGGSSISYDATVDSAGNLQIIPGAGITGSGYVVRDNNKNTVAISITYSAASGTENCRMTMTKE